MCVFSDVIFPKQPVKICFMGSEYPKGTRIKGIHKIPDNQTLEQCQSKNCFFICPECMVIYLILNLPIRLMTDWKEELL